MQLAIELPEELGQELMKKENVAVRKSFKK